MTVNKNEGLLSPLFIDNQSIYTLIIKDIADGVFVAGDRLVTTKLSKRYNTSVNPIREALKQLQGEGFVNVSPNSGARVNKFEHNAMRDVFEILQLLDPYLIEWFVLEHSKEHLNTLQLILKKMENIAEGDHVAYRNLDTYFHWTMYNQHYNKSAVELWRQKRIVLQIMHVNLPISEARVQQSLIEHREILSAIEERNIELSLSILKKHISNSGKYWSRHS